MGPGGGRPPVSSRAPSLIEEGSGGQGGGQEEEGPHPQYPREPPASSTRRKTRRGPVGRENQASWRRTGWEGVRRTRRLRSPSLIEEEDEEGARRSWTPTLIKRTGQKGRGGCQEEESPQPHQGGGQEDEEGARRTRRGQVDEEEGSPRLLEIPRPHRRRGR